MEIGAREAILGLSLVAVVVGLIFAVGQWKGRLDSDRAQFKTFMEKVEITLRVIHDKLESIRLDVARIEAVRNTTSRSSPLQLTELGRKVSARLEATQWAKETAEALRENIKGMESYGIHAYCRDYVENTKLSDEMDVLIAACMSEFSIDEQQVLDVLAVELRDMLLDRTS